jgi:hypothetical protein
LLRRSFIAPDQEAEIAAAAKPLLRYQRPQPVIGTNGNRLAQQRGAILAI